MKRSRPRAQYSRKSELVDLTIAIGLMNTYNRLAISFRNTPQAASRSRSGALAEPRHSRSQIDQWSVAFALSAAKEFVMKIFVAGATGAVGFRSCARCARMVIR